MSGIHLTLHMAEWAHPEAPQPGPCSAALLTARPWPRLLPVIEQIACGHDSDPGSMVAARLASVGIRMAMLECCRKDVQHCSPGSQLGVT